MSDEKIESGGIEPPDEAGVNDKQAENRNTNTNPPEVTGGQPAVGDDRPRSTEF